MTAPLQTRGISATSRTAGGVRYTATAANVNQVTVPITGTAVADDTRPQTQLVVMALVQGARGRATAGGAAAAANNHSTGCTDTKGNAYTQVTPGVAAACPMGAGGLYNVDEGFAILEWWVGDIVQPLYRGVDSLTITFQDYVPYALVSAYRLRGWALAYPVVPSGGDPRVWSWLDAASDPLDPTTSQVYTTAACTYFWALGHRMTIDAPADPNGVVPVTAAVFSAPAPNDLTGGGMQPQGVFGLTSAQLGLSVGTQNGWAYEYRADYAVLPGAAASSLYEPGYSDFTYAGAQTSYKAGAMAACQDLAYPLGLSAREDFSFGAGGGSTAHPDFATAVRHRRGRR